jgi:YegS/Rv2252/BmrU family lipid kinase
MKKSIIFIINPTSGTTKKANLPALIEKNIDRNIFEYEIIYTQRPKHATEIATQASQDNTTIVVAVGGDGTINEVAQGLVNTSTILGIVPMGSGNGLARHLKIPLKTAKAIARLNELTNLKIDTCTLNGQLFLCTSGVGFDAEVGYQFAQAKSRGFKTYLKVGFSAFLRYKIQNYEIEINGKSFKQKAWAITLANAGQYGNNAYIAPQADIQDGKLDLCIIEKHPFWASLELFYRIFTKSIQKSKYYKFYVAEEVTIKASVDEPIHLDGEPVEGAAILNYRISSQNLNVLI